MSKQRILYIDLAKGLCMLLVVMVHCGVLEFFPGLYTANVVLFFLLSGYFYHDDMPTKDFLLKKVKTLLVPFVVFYVLSYLIYYTLYWVYPTFTQLTLANGILDIFTQKEYFNGPIWFLLSLFEIQLIVFGIRRLFNGNILYSWICYIALYVVGFKLSLLDINLPLNIDSSLTCTIFFAMGMALKKGNVFDRFDNDNRVQVLVICAMLYIIYLCNPVYCWIAYNRFDCDGMIEVFIIIIAICISKLLFCKAISTPKLRLLSFIGKHTLYILCTHHLIYRPIKLVLSSFLNLPDVISSIIVFILTITICLLTAQWFENLLPWAFGTQKKK